MELLKNRKILPVCGLMMLGLLLLFCLPCFAQVHKKDLDYDQSDTNYINTYISKAEKLISGNTDSAIVFLKTSFEK